MFIFIYVFNRRVAIDKSKYPCPTHYLLHSRSSYVVICENLSSERKVSISEIVMSPSSFRIHGRTHLVIQNSFSETSLRVPPAYSKLPPPEGLPHHSTYLQSSAPHTFAIPHRLRRTQRWDQSLRRLQTLWTYHPIRP